ncbi:MAG: hypothetical protein CMJ89_05275 [Planctomycetes bacterium]|jgi:hypothetical protein|nr:hypothetical protein [Planctomycetota bacterium]
MISNSLLLAAALSWVAPAVFQEETPKEEAAEKAAPQEKKKSLLDELDPNLSGGDDLREEMARLFQEVERNLIAIDDQLAAAGAGDLPLDKVGDSGLDKLLRSQKDKSNKVLADIDRILEITQQLGGT